MLGMASELGRCLAAGSSSSGGFLWSVDARAVAELGAISEVRQLLRMALTVADCMHRPQLHALSRICVADSNKALLLKEGDTRVLDTCATVLSWGMPGAPVDGGGGRQSPLMVRHAQEHCSEALFQLSLSAVGKRTMRAHSGCVRMLRHHARAAAEDLEVGGRCRGALAAMEERRGMAAATSAAAAAAAAGAGHLMISYQWDMQATVLRIAAHAVHQGRPRRCRQQWRLGQRRPNRAGGGDPGLRLRAPGWAQHR